MDWHYGKCRHSFWRMSQIEISLFFFLDPSLGSSWNVLKVKKLISKVPVGVKLTVHAPLDSPAVRPQQFVDGLQNSLKLLLLADLGLGHLGHVQLPARQLLCQCQGEQTSAHAHTHTHRERLSIRRGQSSMMFMFPSSSINQWVVLSSSTAAGMQCLKHVCTRHTLVCVLFVWKQGLDHLKNVQMQRLQTAEARLFAYCTFI